MALTPAQQAELEIATCNALSLNGMGVDPISFAPQPEETAAAALITANIHKLFCVDVAVVEPTGGGGPYPGPAHNKFGPGEIQHFYKPVETEWQYVQEPRLHDKKHVILRIRIAGGSPEALWREKEFLIPERRGKQIIQILNMFNSTRERMKVVARAIKRHVVKGVVKILNLRKRT